MSKKYFGKQWLLLWLILYIVAFFKGSLKSFFKFFGKHKPEVGSIILSFKWLHIIVTFTISASLMVYSWSVWHSLHSCILQTSLWAAFAVRSTWLTSPGWRCCVWTATRSAPKTFPVKRRTVCGTLSPSMCNTAWCESLIPLISSSVFSLLFNNSQLDQNTPVPILVNGNSTAVCNL